MSDVPTRKKYIFGDGNIGEYFWPDLPRSISKHRAYRGARSGTLPGVRIVNRRTVLDIDLAERELAAMPRGDRRKVKEDA